MNNTNEKDEDSILKGKHHLLKLLNNVIQEVSPDYEEKNLLIYNWIMVKIY